MRENGWGMADRRVRSIVRFGKMWIIFHTLPKTHPIGIRIPTTFFWFSVVPEICRISLTLNSSYISCQRSNNIKFQFPSDKEGDIFIHVCAQQLYLSLLRCIKLGLGIITMLSSCSPSLAQRPSLLLPFLSRLRVLNPHSASLPLPSTFRASQSLQKSSSKVRNLETCNLLCMHVCGVWTVWKLSAYVLV